MDSYKFAFSASVEGSRGKPAEPAGLRHAAR